MAISFFSVDRRGFYRVGENLSLLKEDPFNLPYWELQGWFSKHNLKDHLFFLFPAGLSFHGWAYLLQRHDFLMQGTVPYVKHEITVELLFESVRKAFFPDRTSRFQSFFAWETIEEARSFAQPNERIYRLECNESFKADQKLLTVGVQNAACSLCAHRYWSGQGTNEPKWEILLKAPVFVAEQIVL